MSLLKTIRKTLNLGGTELTLSANRVVPQGGCLKGRVVAQAGEFDQEPRKVVLILWKQSTNVPTWHTSRTTPLQEKVVTERLSGPCVFRAGKRYEFPFELRMPLACETSGVSMQTYDHRWALEAYVDLPIALDDHVAFNIHVIPHRIVLALIKVIGPCTGFSAANKRGLFDERDGSTNFVLLPPNRYKLAIKHVLMSAALRARGGAEVVFGFEYRTHALAQRTRLPGIGKIRLRSVTFRRQDLMDARNVFKRAFVSQEIAREFREMLSVS